MAYKTITTPASATILWCTLHLDPRPSAALKTALTRTTHPHTSVSHPVTRRQPRSALPRYDGSVYDTGRLRGDLNMTSTLRRTRPPPLAAVSRGRPPARSPASKAQHPTCPPPPSTRTVPSVRAPYTNSPPPSSSTSRDVWLRVRTSSLVDHDGRQRGLPSARILHGRFRTGS